MLEFFRRNLFLNSLMLLPYTLMVRIESLLHADQPAYASDISPFIAWTNEIIPSLLVQNLLACILVFLQAVYINKIVIKHRINVQITLWPGLVYILLCSIVPQCTYLSAVLIANLFILVAFSDIFKIYKRPFAIKYIFNSGIFISISAMIYPPYIAYLLTGFIGLSIIRSFKTKEMLQYLSGILVPFMLFGSWTFYCGTFQEKMVGLVKFKFGFSSDIMPIDTNGYIFIGLIFLFILIAIFSYNAYSMKKRIQVQKKINILFWMILSALIALFISDSLSIDHLLMLSAPLGILLSMNLLKIKSAIFPELIHLGIIILIFVLHFKILIL